MAKKRNKKSNKSSKSVENSNKEEISREDNYEFNFSFNDIKNFYLRHKKLILNLIPIILIFSLMFYSAYIRWGPVTLNGLEKSVELNTYQNIKFYIAQEVSQKYPLLTPEEKEQLIDKQFNQVLRDGFIRINNQTVNLNSLVQQNFKQIKSKFQINGQTYLLAIDPYVFYRYSWDIMDHGYVGNEIKYNPKTGKYQDFDKFRLAPEGRFVSPSFHVYFEYFMYKLFGLNKNSPIAERFKAIFLIPVIVVMLTVIPAFLLMRKLTNDLYATYGSLILFSVGVYVSRTVAGFVDTDSYNVFFPLIITLFVVLSLYEKNKKLSIFYAFLAGLFQIFFMYVWSAGWFILVFLLFSYIAYLVYKYAIIILFNTKDKIKKTTWYSLLTFIFTSYILNYIINKNDLFISVYHNIFRNISNIVTISKTYIWPNVYSTVAELNPASISSIISSTGGKLAFFFGLLGIFYLVSNKVRIIKNNFLNITYYSFAFIWFLLISFLKEFSSLTANEPLIYLFLVFLPIEIAFVLAFFDKKTDIEIFVALLLTSWFAGTIFMSLNGVRFILLLSTPAAISISLGLYYFARSIDNFIKNEFEAKKSFFIGTISTLIIFLFIFVPMFKSAYAISSQSTPNMTDGWYSTLIKIKNDSKPNAIISSWWDFGHEFAAIAHRGVTFDGASQTTPQSHWIGRILMDNNENQALGILRMLVCSGNKAFYYLDNITDPKDSGVNIVENLLYKIIPYNLTREQRIEIIKNYPYYHFTDKEINEILNLTTCKNPPTDYFIASQDMIGKSGVWAHWGSWNFTKKYVYDNYQRESPEEIAKILHRNVSTIKNLISQLKEIDFEASVKDVKRTDLINRWLAPYPSYIPIHGKYLFDCTGYNLIKCSIGLEINLSSGAIINPYSNQLKIRRLIYPGVNNTMKVINYNNKGDIDITLIPVGMGKYQILLSVYPLGDSIFTRMFFLNGYGLKYFKLFNTVHTVQGWKINTFKVDWKQNTTINNIKINKSKNENNNASINNSNVRNIKENITHNLNISSNNSTNLTLLNTSK